MAIEIEYTPIFEKELRRLAKKYPSVYKDLAALITQLETSPETGTPLGGNLYKIRLSITSKGKGKSGGARVITYVLIKNERVYLAAIYDKSEHSTINADRLLKILKDLLP